LIYIIIKNILSTSEVWRPGAWSSVTLEASLPSYKKTFSLLEIAIGRKSKQQTWHRGLLLPGETKMRPLVLLVVTLVALGVLAALPLGEGDDESFPFAV
jgi:hypothetical protein